MLTCLRSAHMAKCGVSGADISSCGAISHVTCFLKDWLVKETGLVYWLCRLSVMFWGTAAGNEVCRNSYNGVRCITANVIDSNEAVEGLKYILFFFIFSHAFLFVFSFILVLLLLNKLCLILWLNYRSKGKCCVWPLMNLSRKYIFSLLSQVALCLMDSLGASNVS